LRVLSAFSPRGTEVGAALQKVGRDKLELIDHLAQARFLDRA
jgi:hypothetical protein